MVGLGAGITDPYASPTREKKKGASGLGYPRRHVVDGGKARVVLLGTLVDGTRGTENLPMP